MKLKNIQTNVQKHAPENTKQNLITSEHRPFNAHVFFSKSYRLAR